MHIKMPLRGRPLISSLVVLGLIFCFSAPMLAQHPGNKAVFNVNNGIAPSTVWIDASAWWADTSQPPDLCLYLQSNVFTNNYNVTNYPNGAAIDARGLAFGVSGGNQIACSVDPFGALTGPPPNTVLLLPSGNIHTQQTWIIPNNTRIVGDEQQTTIYGDCGSCSYILGMGGVNTINNQQKPLCPPTGCTSVGIEHLALLEGSANAGGIQNQYSQTGSYVKDVSMAGLLGTGLSIAGPYSNSPYPGATNSGPYSDIVFNAGTSGTPSCVDLEAQTQGIHGLTCTGNTLTTVNGNAGIAVKASNNTIEDVHIESFWDGIQVGPACPTNITSCTIANVLISNVTGTTTANRSGGVTQNTVHICAPNGSCGSSNTTVEDVTVLHAMNDNSNPGQTTVADDTSKNSIVSCYTSAPVAGPGCAAPLSTGMYILGEPYGQSSGNPSYSIFTSSPTTPNGNYRNGSSYMPTWGVGANSPSAPNQYCSPVGAIYSWTGASSGKSVYVCKPVSSQSYGHWTAIP